MTYEIDRDEPNPRQNEQASSTEEPLTLYLRSISKIPVLSRDEQFALAEELAAERKAFLDRAFSIRPVARALVDCWRDRKRAGRSTGPLSSRHLDGTGREPEKRLDRALAGTDVRHSTVTVIPQLARRLGSRTDPWYARLAALPPLRSHRMTLATRLDA